MAVVEKSFHATLKKREPAKVRVATLLIQSNNAYKGDFATIQDLRQVLAFSGDYADVFETNTRWAFIDGQWKDTKQKILINPTLATKQDVGVLEERVASLETAIENPTLLITKI